MMLDLGQLGKPPCRPYQAADPVESFDSIDHLTQRDLPIAAPKVHIGIVLVNPAQDLRESIFVAQLPNRIERSMDWVMVAAPQHCRLLNEQQADGLTVRVLAGASSPGNERFPLEGLPW